MNGIRKIAVSICRTRSSGAIARQEFAAPHFIVSSGARTWRREMVLKMRKSSSPNMRQPAHAIAASAKNVTTSEIGEPMRHRSRLLPNRHASRKSESRWAAGASIRTSDAFLKNALPVLRLPNPPTRSADVDVRAVSPDLEVQRHALPVGGAVDVGRHDAVFHD